MIYDNDQSNKNAFCVANIKITMWFTITGMDSAIRSRRGDLYLRRCTLSCTEPVNWLTCIC